MTTPRFNDFTEAIDPVQFKINDDVFVCVPDIALDVLGDLSELATAAESRRAQLDRMLLFFDGIMEPESYARFKARTGRDEKTHPIGMRTIRNILPWLAEVYGLRPTQPSGESGDGSTPDGISSTEDASSAE